MRLRTKRTLRGLDVNPEAIQALFGARLAKQFRPGALPERHLIARRRRAHLPAALTSGALTDLQTLSKQYVGPLNAVGGRRGVSLEQFEVAGDALSLYNAGLTVHFQNLAKGFPAVAAWAQELERAFGLPRASIKPTAWASPGAKTGLSFHFDPSPVVIVQLSGTKRIWVSGSNGVEWPLQTFTPGTYLTQNHVAQFGAKPPPAGPGAATLLTLEVGDVLYMPPGYWHATEHRVASLSLSLFLEAPRAVDVVLARLRKHLLQDPAWRRPLVGGWDHGDGEALTRQTLTTLIASLPRSLGSLDAADCLLETGTDDSLNWAHAGTHFVRAPAMRCTFRPLRDRVRLQVCATGATTRAEATFAREHLRYFKWVASRTGSFSLGEVLRQFPELTLGAGRDLVRLMARVRAITVVDFTPVRSAEENWNRVTSQRGL